jgi:predicted amino acid dehydrogenase
MSALKEAKIVVVATAATEEIIKSEFLKENAIVYDLTQPRNTSPKILEERSDVIIIDGGIIETPVFDFGMDIGLKKHQAYACLNETLICALENLNENLVGYPTPKDIKKMLSLFDRYSNYFKLNIFQSFGKSLNEKLEPI